MNQILKCKWINGFGEECKGNLILVAADEPWSPEHYMCETCDSTYNKFDKNIQVDRNKDN